MQKKEENNKEKEDKNKQTTRTLIAEPSISQYFARGDRIISITTACEKCGLTNEIAYLW